MGVNLFSRCASPACLKSSVAGEKENKLSNLKAYISFFVIMEKHEQLYLWYLPCGFLKTWG